MDSGRQEPKDTASGIRSDGQSLSSGAERCWVLGLVEMVQREELGGVSLFSKNPGNCYLK